MSDAFDFWDVFLYIFWLMLLLAWIYLIISIIGDIFRDHELSGIAKAVWIFLLIWVPWLGALLYLFVRGGSMSERARQAKRAKSERTQSYLQGAGRPSTAQELSTLVELRDSGMITASEYEDAKTKALA